jgi:hypothetical protein
MSQTPPEVKASSSHREAIRVLNRSFPLVVLFQLATCSAALLACVDGPALGQAIDGPSAAMPLALAAVVGVVITGGLIGALTGLGQIQKWRSAVLGFFVGSLSGLLILCVYAAPAPVSRMAAAAAVILLSTVAVRLRSA